ncbi:hypothetical protein HMPREF1633_05205 [Tissierellia bacterium S5-A11]|nr:hypothetical protein HMPREF1633_05205 [Tissierellia bacterium S5-A11]
MASYKKTLLSKLFPVLVLSVFLLSACSNKNSPASGKDLDFLLDDKGYPKNNLALVNGKTYPMDLAGKVHTFSEIEVKIDKGREDLEISLPQYLPINTWSLEKGTYLDLTSYSKIAYPIKKENMLEGISPNVQNFKIQLLEGGTELVFKWANVNEADKPFKDKQEDYLLKIILLD